MQKVKLRQGRVRKRGRRKRGRRKRDDFPLVNMNAGGGGDPSHLKKTENKYY